jgi:DNA polymerase-3 subunit beta
MELTVRKSDLLPELQLFQGIVERKNTIPILANVLIEANGDGNVQLLATDLEVGLRGRCPASVAKGGALTIPAKKLYEIVRALPDTEIHIKQGAKGSVKVSADRFDSRMQTLPREDFPTLPETTEELPAVTLPRAGFKEMVGKTQFAITGEDTRYFLNGALFVLEPDKMNLVATDGHRLALVSTTRRQIKGEPDELQAILPKKTLWELARLLVDGEDDLRYTVGENHLFFDVDGRQLISRVIDAQFPAYERVIPKSNNRKIEFERDRLTSAIKRVALLSSDRSRAVKFSIGKEKIDITSSSPEVGEATETLPIQSDGDEVEICFNAQYVLDFLGVADSENVELDLKDDVSQAIMRPVGVEGCDYTYVIMPMRV